ncbi:RYamide receptor-like [Stylophora pistillata]|uniref:RYamide receptor-like n=1 Tax=Stylophora pistillata TaxID=50429 RepID=UPI000C052FD2|nr:RYamide receptor-like [Stylophora pistillata]
MTTNVNVTTNATHDTSCFDPIAARTRETTVLSGLFVASLVGNIFIGLVVCKTKTPRKPINFFVLNMAMSDLLFPIFLLPRIVTRLYVDTWLIKGPLGEAMCKIFSYSIEVSILVSIQSMLLVAVDRFVDVVFPLRSPLISSKLCCLFILATWIISLAMKSPDFFAWKLVENRNGPACKLQWKEAFGESLPFESYMLALTVVFWFIPLVLITTLYITIVYKIKSQKTQGEQTVNVREQGLQRERNVLKTSVAVVFQYFQHIAYFLAQSNCAINPYMFFIFSGNYRQGLKSLLSYLCRTNLVEPPNVELKHYSLHQPVQNSKEHIISSEARNGLKSLRGCLY